MDEDVAAPADDSPDEASADLENLGHPRGTLAIVLLYAAIFALTWLGL